MSKPNRPWYKERYISQQLKGGNIYAWRIREEGSERVIAKDLNRIDADIILEFVNQVHFVAFS